MKTPATSTTSQTPARAARGLATAGRRHSLLATRCPPLLLALSLFSAAPCVAQIVSSTVCNQFRTTLAGSSTYVLYETNTYYTVPGSWYFPDMTFDNNGTASNTNEAAVYLQGNETYGSAVFTGSNITVLGTGTSGNRRRAFTVTRSGQAFLTDSVIRQTDPNAAAGSYALYVTTRGNFTGTKVTIEACGPQTNAINIGNSLYNLLNLNGALIQNTGSAAALCMEGSGVVLLNSATINTTGAIAPGVMIVGGRPRVTLNSGLIHTTGASAPGLWLGSGGVSSTYGAGVLQFEGHFVDALIRSDAGMGIEVNTNFPTLPSRPALTTPSPTWAGYYDLFLASSTISGELGAIRMTSSATNAAGNSVVEIKSVMRLQLQDSALDGDVFINDGAQFILIAASSQLNGALRLSGSAPLAAVTLDDSAITGGIVLSGGAAIDLSINASTITGTFAAAGSSFSKILLTGSSTIDAVVLDDFATLELTIDSTSSVLGEFSVQGGATYTLLPADNRSLVFSNHLTLAAGGNLRVAPGTNLTLTSPLALADPDATITLANIRGDDLVLAAGLTGKGLLVIHGFHADILGQPEVRVVRDDTGHLDPDAFTLASAVSNSLFAYHTLENRPDGAYLTGGGFSAAGSAVFNTPALAAADYFDSFSPVFRHLAGLRENGLRGALQRHTDGDSGAFWLSGRSSATTADGALPGLSFRQQTSAFAAGADLCWGGGRDEHTITAGVFADTAYTYRKFAAKADGRASIYGAGLYTLYQRPAGWHAAATLRVEETQNAFDSRDAGSALSGSYTARFSGLALEFGWRLPGLSLTGWWAEPSIEVGFGRLNGSSYNTRSNNPDNSFLVEQDSATATHYRANITFGRDLGKHWGFRAHFNASSLSISGGAVSGGSVTAADFQISGIRAEAALGIVRHLGRNSRLWLDCNTTLAAEYKRPWSLALGWNMAW